MLKVLLVDDEADAIEVLEWVLTDLGFVVRTAFSGEQAVDVAREFRPDILTTDQCLQGELSGADVIRRLRQSDAGLRAVLTSGLPREHLESEVGDIADLQVLGKPFTWRDLRAELELRPPVSGVMKIAPNASLR